MDLKGFLDIAQRAAMVSVDVYCCIYIEMGGTSMFTTNGGQFYTVIQGQSTETKMGC